MSWRTGWLKVTVLIFRLRSPIPVTRSNPHLLSQPINHARTTSPQNATQDPATIHRTHGALLVNPRIQNESHIEG